MDVVGGTFVGGSSTGWAIADPNANAAALGLVTQPVYGGGTYSAPAASFGMPQAFGGGTVGGSWSPEPIGNNQILYGHYSASGALALPQAFYGQQGTALTTPATTTPATTTPAAATPAAAAPAATPAAPATTTPKPATTEKKPAEKPAADADKKPEPKKVTVKSGDTLSEIAAKHGTTWQKLYEANKGVIGSNPNVIKPGQSLKIPA